MQKSRGFFIVYNLLTIIVNMHKTDGGMFTKIVQVAQKSNKSDNVSIMIITTDSDVDDATMETINKIDGIKNAQYIKLNA